jgi:hypothetical protein
MADDRFARIDQCEMVGLRIRWSHTDACSGKRVGLLYRKPQSTITVTNSSISFLQIKIQRKAQLLLVEKGTISGKLASRFCMDSEAEKEVIRKSVSVPRYVIYMLKKLR